MFMVVKWNENQHNNMLDHTVSTMKGPDETNHIWNVQTTKKVLAFPLKIA